MHRLSLPLGLILVGAAAAGCGVGANKRILTRPDSYAKALGWMQYGNPVDVEALVAEYPALKGKVVTAPEYLEEFLAIRDTKIKDNQPVFEYQIAAGSTIDIEVVGEEELSIQSLFVPPDGFDYLPYIGRVQLAGRTRDQLIEDLEERYRKILKRPQVLVHLRQGIRQVQPGQSAGFDPSGGFLAGQGRVSVLGGGFGTSGGANQVGLFGGETIFSLLGGNLLSEDSEWRAIRIIRRDDQDPFHRGRIIFVDAWEFIANADVRQDIPLRPGDFIFIPRKFTLGEQINHDFDLLLSYAGKFLTADSLYDQLKTTFFE